MRLNLKFSILIGLVVIISYGITFYRTSGFQNELIETASVQQARMLHHQLKLTRQWVADHKGLFFLKSEGVEANPFLEEGQILDSSGQVLVKRNPAMVTRELSEYAAREGFGRYGVTSLKPLNPQNAPNDFERRSLLSFEQEGIFEAMEIEETPEGGRRLLYIAPLKVDDSCLECHARQGYKVGDIRGGLSVSIPMDWAYSQTRKNDRMLLIIALATIVVVFVTIFLLINFVVVRRLEMLAREMDEFSGKSDQVALGPLPSGKDEIGLLAGKYRELCTRLVTSQRELARTQEQVFQSEKLAALGRLVAGVGHEINNPLAGMLNCVKSLGEAPGNVEMQERYLPLIAKGLGRIKHTVRQLLNFGRREPLHPREANLEEITRECLELLAYSSGNITFELDFQPAQTYLLDVEALKQIIMNIGINAVHAMPRGGTFSVRCRRQQTNIVLEFLDTGIGMDGEQLKMIFDPFYTTKDVGEGTGLGLFVTYSIIERMGGKISVESRKGQGSRFTVTLPVTPCNNQPDIGNADD